LRVAAQPFYESRLNMRIIAGRLRRRKLETNPGLVTRPITDRVKESLFARLEADLQGKRVADVFAGTGTIGLEALSRGAACVTLIESDRKAVELLRLNVQKLKVEDETLVWPADVLRCSFRPKNAERFVPFEVIFFDPPYKMVPDIAPGSPLYKSLQRLADPRVSTADALLLFRAPEQATFQLPPEWQRQSQLTMAGMDLLWCGKCGELTESSPCNTSDVSGDANPQSHAAQE
jgi:16S rRNA (guanine966-N2)-methyltransferase